MWYLVIYCRTWENSSIVSDGGKEFQGLFEEFCVHGDRWTKYLMSHLDEYTGWVKVECLKGKNSSEVLKGLENAQRGRGSPKVVKTDGGKEFQGAVEDA